MDLGSLNLDGIENIINSMSQKDIEDLSAIASQLFSGDSSNQSAKQEPPSDGIDFETVTKIASVIGRLSSQPKDPGCELLTALKPMLSPERLKKILSSPQAKMLINMIKDKKE